MFKNRIVPILLIILLLITALLAGYLILTRKKDPDRTFIIPRLVRAEVEITHLSREKTVMTAHLLLNNPMPVALKADSLSYSLYIGRKQVAKSSRPEPVSLQGKGSNWVNFPVTLYNDDLVQVLKQAEAQGLDSIDYGISGTVYTGIRDFTLEATRRLPLIYIPEIRLEEIEVDSLNLSGTGLRCMVKIVNKNAFNLEAKDITFRISFGDQRWFSGQVPGLVSIPDSSTRELDLPLFISFKDMAQTLPDLLRKGADIKYQMHMEFRLNAEMRFIRNSLVVVENEGSARSLAGLIKKK
ncbi:MAG: LEA type 2 family protein [Bacteroidota bacterium]